MLYNVVLVSPVQQQESAICIHISPPSWTTRAILDYLQVIRQHWAGLPVLWSSFPHAIYFTHSSVHMSVILSQFVPPCPSPPAPTLCRPQVLSLHLCLYSCPANRFISTIFLDSIHIACEFKSTKKKTLWKWRLWLLNVCFGTWRKSAFSCFD